MGRLLDIKGSYNKSSNQPQIKVKPCVMYRRGSDVIQQSTADTAEIIKRSQNVSSILEEYASDMMDYLGFSKKHIVLAPNKTSATMADKAIRKNYPDVSCVLDPARYRQLFSSPEEFLKVRELFSPESMGNEFHRKWTNKENGSVKILIAEDYYAHPAKYGYRGMNYNILVTLPDGEDLICEGQWMHEKMQKTDKVSHGLFEELRDMEKYALKQGRLLSTKENYKALNLLDSNRTLYDEKSNQLGLNSLLSSQWKGHKKLVNENYEPVVFSLAQ